MHRNLASISLLIMLSLTLTAIVLGRERWSQFCLAACMLQVALEILVLMLKRVFEFVSCFIYWRPGFFFLFYSKGEKPFQLTIVMMHSLVILIVWNRLRIFCLYLHPPLKKKKIPPQQKKKLLFKLLTSCNSEKKHQLCIDRSYFFKRICLVTDASDWTPFI